MDGQTIVAPTSNPKATTKLQYGTTCTANLFCFRTGIRLTADRQAKAPLYYCASCLHGEVDVQRLPPRSGFVVFIVISTCHITRVTVRYKDVYVALLGNLSQSDQRGVSAMPKIHHASNTQPQRPRNQIPYKNKPAGKRTPPSPPRPGEPTPRKTAFRL